MSWWQNSCWWQDSVEFSDGFLKASVVSRSNDPLCKKNLDSGVGETGLVVQWVWGVPGAASEWWSMKQEIQQVGDWSGQGRKSASVNPLSGSDERGLGVRGYYIKFKSQCLVLHSIVRWLYFTTTLALVYEKKIEEKGL